MGVHGLWKVLAPCGRRVDVQTLRGKTLAVDASIWLTQFIKAMRNRDGRMTANAHLVGSLRRILKLLFHKIKPIFVFDGGAPVLKKRITQARREKVDQSEQALQRAAQKLLLNQLMQQKLNATLPKPDIQMAPQKKRQNVVDNFVLKESAPSSTQSSQQSPAKTLANGKGVAIELNDSDDSKDSDDSDEDIEWSSAPSIKLQKEEEVAATQESPDEIHDAMETDQIIAQLPVSAQGVTDLSKIKVLPRRMQYEVIARLKDKRLLRDSKRSEFLPVAGDPRKYSALQLKHFLKDVKLKKRLDAMEFELTSNAKDGQRIASEAKRHYLLIDSNAQKKSPTSASTTPVHASLPKDNTVSKTDSGGVVLTLNAEQLERLRMVGRKVEDINAIPPKPTQVKRKLVSIEDDDETMNLAISTASHMTSYAGEIIRKAVKRLKDSNLESRKTPSPQKNPAPRVGTSPQRKSLSHPVSSSSTSSPGIKDRKPSSPSKLPCDVNDALKYTSDEEVKVEQVIRSKSTDRAMASGEASKQVHISLSDTSDEESGEEESKQRQNAVVEKTTTKRTKEVQMSLSDTSDEESDLDTNDAETREAKSQEGLDTSVDDKEKKTSAEVIALLDEEKASTKVLDESNGECQGRGDPMVSAEERPEAQKCATSDGPKSKPKEIEAPKSEVFHESKETIAPSNIIEESLKPKPVPFDVAKREALPADMEPPRSRDSNASNDNTTEAQHNDSGTPSKLEVSFESSGGGGDDNQVHDISFDANLDEEDFLDQERDREKAEEEARILKEQEHILEVARQEKVSEMQKDILRQEASLVRQRNAAQRDSETVTPMMLAEVKELLEVFGLPYIEAPMEAEAQCADLELRGVVDGVITDDCDVFLFGARNVYRNIFDEKKFVQAYKMVDVERELGLNRQRVINLALLLGSDYTTGVKGIGVVNACEVVASFPDLGEFAMWVNDVTETIENTIGTRKGKSQAGPATAPSSEDSEEELKKRAFKASHKGAKKRWKVSDEFPSRQVIEAYEKPVVNLKAGSQGLNFQNPDLSAIRTFCARKLGWSPEETDIQVRGPLREFTSRDSQTTLDSFVVGYSAKNRFAAIRSKRLKQAVTGLRDPKQKSEGVLFVDSLNLDPKPANDQQ